MRKKDLEAVRALFSRRQALAGMGALIGTSAAGCGDDGGGGGTSGAGSSEGSSGSSGSSGIDGSSGIGSTSGVDGTGSGGSSGADGSSSSGDDTTTGGVDECAGTSELTPEELLAEIDTIVVVMMENRSFDHYFGSATFLEGWTVDGLDGTESNLDLEGNTITVFAMDNLEIADPPHDWDPVHLQWNLGDMDGFVIQHELVHPATHTEVMGYYQRSQLPTLYALAESYTLCDQWHCSLLGPTWPNRFYLHCGTSGGQKSNFPELSLRSVWDALDDAGISARNYYAEIPWVWGAFANPLASYTDGIDEFFAAAEAGTLPQFSIIDPDFGTIGSEGANDDHPAHNVTLGQLFLSSVYQALAQSPQWNSCLLVITYDEHGGFYDHVAPPEATDDDPDFDRLGVRVPGLVIGPHVRRGCVNSTLFEHSSVLATLVRKFGIEALTSRVAAANDLSSCINPDYLGNPQPPTPVPMIDASIDELLVPGRPGSHPEMREMVADGRIPVPPHLQGPGAKRRHALRMLAHAERLGVLRLRR